jgi:bilirubin oxidase
MIRIPVQFGLMVVLVAINSLCLASDRPFQALRIPQAISGKQIDLTLHKAMKSFWKGATTATYAYNDESFWGPTVIVNQGEEVQFNVKNGLDEPTTAHWHGMHIPAIMDGGPHQLVKPGETWSPHFTIRNNAGTYWYHPHAHETTQKQLTYGAGGLLIVRDAKEASLNLPRTYGVDDIPVVMTSRRFYMNDQFSFEGDNDKYGDYELVNGTLDAEFTAPAQWVRLRILNAEIERGYNLGFSDNRTFYQIATDGGLVDKPVALKRLKLMVGERTEILVNLGADKVGSSVDLMCFNSGQMFGYPGQEPGTSRPNGSYLNNRDFRVLHLNVGPATASAVTALPVALVKNAFPKVSEVTKSRTVNILGGEPGNAFNFDGKGYSMHQIGQVIKLGATEKWTIQNSQVFGHSFHIHDVQFKIIARSDGPVAGYEQGWKDSVYVPRNESVTFLAKFDDFASNTDAFMYHCHMANHEDGGLMSQFVVVKDPVAYRRWAAHPVTAAMAKAANRSAGTVAASFVRVASTGARVDLAAVSAIKPVVLYFIEKDCPCSKEAARYMSQLQREYGEKVAVVGVINASSAAQWSAEVKPAFPVVADPSLQIAKEYGAKRSVYTTLIAPGGRIVKTYAGYGQGMLTELSSKIARMAAVSPRLIATDGAPVALTSGCLFR